jgi:hypothetical protein
LGSLWRALPWETKLAIVDQVAEYDKALTAMEFNAHGCIYFKNDLQRLTGRTEVTGLYSQQRDSNFNDYAIGPLTKAELWVSGRANLQMDRGPCRSSLMLGPTNNANIRRARTETVSAEHGRQ